MRRGFAGIVALAVVVSACHKAPRVPVWLELFAVSLAPDGDSIRYTRRVVGLSQSPPVDPDTAAFELARPTGRYAMLHSTSWRWEPDGTIVLTYLAYFEVDNFSASTVARLSRKELGPTLETDPNRPRPKVIRETDVLAHGMRHLSFLVRNDQNGRLAAALSPRSLAFFRTIADQLAGRLR
jgi:hypothetical protein